MPAVHPLAAAVEQGSANPDDLMHAQADAEQIEALVAEAVALSGATEATRTRLVEIVRQVDALVQPWRVNFPAKVLVDWHEAVVRRRLFTTAVALFGRAGELLAPRPSEPWGRARV